MQKKKILDMIKSYKKDKSCLLDVIITMQPLINKYARKMYKFEYEDMQQEFSVAIIESIIKIKLVENENQCIAYIHNAVKNRYFELCRKSMLLDSELSYESESLECFSAEGRDVFAEAELFADLEKLGKTVNVLKSKIAKRVVEEWSDYEIANQLGVSRQYVNKCKKEIFRDLISKE